MGITYDSERVYVNGIHRAPEHMVVPNVKLDTVPSGGKSCITHGFLNVRTILDAQGEAVGWGMACLHDGVCENLCKPRNEKDFEFCCPEHGGDSAIEHPAHTA